MDSMIRFLLFLLVLDTSPAGATNAQISHFKGIVCNQCHQWCENTDLVTAGSARVGKAGPRGARGRSGPRGPVGRPGDIGPPGRVGPVGPTGPQGEINMTRIEQSMDRKINEALQMITSSSCDGVKLESVFARDHSGGVFNSYIPTIGFKGIYCDVTDDGGNWTVFQRRMNGDVYFYRGWDDYVKGFGDLQGDHWLGLEALHQLTKTGNKELKIKMITRDGIYWVAKYSSFRIGPGSDNFRLHVSGYSGNSTGDWLSHQNNYQFSTKDADHDGAPYNCASLYEAGWWYCYCNGSCSTSNLNGNFNKTDRKGIWWYYSSDSNLLRFSEMKIRKRA